MITSVKRTATRASVPSQCSISNCNVSLSIQPFWPHSPANSRQRLR